MTEDMSRSTVGDIISRRSLLAGAAGGALVSFAGCMGIGEGDSEEEDQEDTSSQPLDESGDGGSNEDDSSGREEENSSGESDGPSETEEDSTSSTDPRALIVSVQDEVDGYVDRQIMDIDESESRGIETGAALTSVNAEGSGSNTGRHELIQVVWLMEDEESAADAFEDGPHTLTDTQEENIEQINIGDEAVTHEYPYRGSRATAVTIRESNLYVAVTYINTEQETVETDLVTDVGQLILDNA